MKKLLLALWAGLLLQVGVAGAQSIRLRLPDTTALVGSSFLMPVYVDSSLTGRSVLSYQIQLSYTSSQLLADSLVTTGTLSANASPIANFGGSGLVTVAAATATPLVGTGVLFYVRFRVISNTGGYNSAISFGSSANTFLNQGSPALTFRNGNVNVPSLPFINVSIPTNNMVVGDTVQASASGGRSPYTWRLSDSTRGTIQSLTPTTARFIAGSAGRTRIVAVDSNGFSGQSPQDQIVHNFRMWTRDSSRLQGTEWLMPIYVGSLTPWNVLSGSFEIQFSNYQGLGVVGIERTGTLLAAVNQTFFAAQGNNSWEVSFANATPVTGSGILCYVRVSIPNASTSNFSYQVQLLNTLFNQNLTALTSTSNQTAIALPQIAISPNTAELVAGESRQFTASNGFAPYRWSVSDSTLATISASGLLTARQGGSIRVTARDTVGAAGTSGNIVLYDTRVYVRDTVLITGDSLVDVAVFMDQLPQGKSITAVSMAFDYNNNMIRPLGVLQAGTASANWAGAANQIGTNRYSIALAGTTPQAAAGNLFFIRFRVLPGFTVNNTTSLSNFQVQLNEGNPNLLLVNGQIRSLPCNPVATVSPSGNVNFCANQPVQLTGSSGTAYQYQWSRNGSPIAGATGRLFTPSQSGNYTLRVSLNSTCFVVSDTVRVTINPAPIAQIRPYADTLNACHGDTVRLSAYFEPGYTLQWLRNGSVISGATDTVFRATQSGSYTVRATLNGCQTISAVQAVMIRPLPTKPTISVTGSPVCAGDSATLRIPATTAAVQWFGLNGPIPGATDTVLRVPPGRYTVRLTSAFGCTALADSVSVNPATASAQIDPSGPTTFCQGGSVNLDLTQQTSFVRWFRNGIQLPDTIRPLTVTVGGTYTANYRLLGNTSCTFSTPAIQVTVIPRPVVTFDSLAPVCVNAPHFALVGGLPAGGTYVGPGVVNNRFYPASLQPGTYQLKYGFQQNGCSDTAIRSITVLPLPGTTLAQQAPVCISNAVFALTGGFPLGGTYFGTGVSAGNFNPAIAGVGTHLIGYTTQNANGCRDTAYQNILVNPLPVATISQGAQASFCTGSSLVLNASPVVGMNFRWLRNGLPVTGQQNATLTVTQTGAYQVIVTNAATQCFDTSDVTTVSINPLPTAGIAAAGPTTFCSGSSVVLNASPTTGVSYTWLLNGNVLTGQSAANLTASAAGAYRVVVTNANGCSDTSSAIVVTLQFCGFVEGNVKYLNQAATPMTNTQVTLLNQQQQVVGQTTTNANGGFSFNNTGNGQFSLQFNTAKPWGGVNATDALAASRYFVGLAPLSGLRLRVADVNMSNQVNTTDALQMARRFTGDINSFAAGDWAFEQPVVVVNNDTAFVQVGALTYGDINGSYLPNVQLRLGREVLLSSKGYLQPTAQSWSIQTETAVELGAMSLVLTLPEGIQVHRVSVPGSKEQAQFTRQGRQLRISWFSLQPLTLHAGDEVLQLHFNGTATATEAELVLEPGCELADAWAHPLQEVRLRAPQMRNYASLELFASNYPNPFTSTTKLEWMVPEAGDVLIRITDGKGRLMGQWSYKSMDAGAHELLLPADDWQAGAYQCELLYTAEKRMERKVLRMIKQ